VERRGRDVLPGMNLAKAGSKRREKHLRRNFGSASFTVR
jgi:hypothetical protein